MNKAQRRIHAVVILVGGFFLTVGLAMVIRFWPEPVLGWHDWGRGPFYLPHTWPVSLAGTVAVGVAEYYLFNDS